MNKPNYSNNKEIYNTFQDYDIDRRKLILDRSLW